MHPHPLSLVLCPLGSGAQGGATANPANITKVGLLELGDCKPFSCLFWIFVFQINFSWNHT
jgi:hypothetical protein